MTKLVKLSKYLSVLVQSYQICNLPHLCQCFFFFLLRCFYIFLFCVRSVSTDAKHRKWNFCASLIYIPQNIFKLHNFCLSKIMFVNEGASGEAVWKPYIFEISGHRPISIYICYCLCSLSNTDWNPKDPGRIMTLSCCAWWYNNTCCPDGDTLFLFSSLSS